VRGTCAASFSSVCSQAHRESAPEPGRTSPQPATQPGNTTLGTLGSAFSGLRRAAKARFHSYRVCSPHTLLVQRVGACCRAYTQPLAGFLTPSSLSLKHTPCIGRLSHALLANPSSTTLFIPLFPQGIHPLPPLRMGSSPKDKEAVKPRPFSVDPKSVWGFQSALCANLGPPFRVGRMPELAKLIFTYLEV